MYKNKKKHNLKKTCVGLLGYKGFVGSAIAKELNKKNINFIRVSRENYKKNIKYKYDFLINCSSPSKRFWAKKNPSLDYMESVEKVKFFLNEYNFKKFIHISSISARCQPKTIYGKHKKKAETLVCKEKNYLIIRLGPMFHTNLKKGVLIDLLNSNTVFVNGKSKYSFTDLNWIAKWIVKNMKERKGIIELGSQDFFKLDHLAKKLSSKSKFSGKIDDQVIKSNLKYNTSSTKLITFLKKNEKKF